MILSMIRGYSIPFTLPPKQSATPSSHFFPKEIDLVDQKVQSMLKKGVFSIEDPVQKIFYVQYFW